MRRLGTHPRFSHMALRALDLGFPELGTVVANLLEAGDIIRWGPLGPVVQSRDIMLRLRALAVYAKVLRVPLSAYRSRATLGDESGELALTYVHASSWYPFQRSACM